MRVTLVLLAVALLCAVVRSQDAASETNVGVLGVGSNTQCNAQANVLQAAVVPVGNCINDIVLPYAKRDVDLTPLFTGNFVHVAVCKTFSDTGAAQYSYNAKSNDFPTFKVSLACPGGQLVRYSLPLNAVRSISGMVLDFASFLPVAGATVTHDLLQVSVTSDENGMFVMPYSVPGSNNLTVSAPGYVSPVAMPYTFEVDGADYTDANLAVYPSTFKIVAEWAYATGDIDITWGAWSIDDSSLICRVTYDAPHCDCGDITLQNDAIGAGSGNACEADLSCPTTISETISTGDLGDCQNAIYSFRVVPYHIVANGTITVTLFGANDQFLQSWTENAQDIVGSWEILDITNYGFYVNTRDLSQPVDEY